MREPSTNVQLNIGFEDFVTETGALKMTKVADVLWQLRKINWRTIIEADPRKTTPEIAEELNVDDSTVARHLYQMENEIIHYNFLDPGKTITAEKYYQEINKMHQELQRSSPALVNRKGPIFLHDNTQPHVSQMISQKLNELAYKTLSYSTNSSDLSSTDYHLFQASRQLPARKGIQQPSIN
uniref:Histone-lysine N-methyltransferase SETMAR n=1 Tax=Heterorhabditis bacteriophora TaxID=37862 RepID=A0A1I7XPA7_HETBA